MGSSSVAGMPTNILAQQSSSEDEYYDDEEDEEEEKKDDDGDGQMNADEAKMIDVGLDAKPDVDNQISAAGVTTTLGKQPVRAGGLLVK